VSYLNPAIRLSPTPEIVVRFTKENLFCGWGWALDNHVGSCRWSARETIRDSACNKPWFMPGYIQHHQYLTDNTGVISNKREIFQCNKTRVILLKVEHGRWTTVQLIICIYTVMCKSTWICLLMTLLVEIIGSLNFHILMEMKNIE